MADKSYSFRPNARLLLLLGDELIPDGAYAVFELVKNAYDADASEVHVVLHVDEENENRRIVITDDGHGMDLETIRRVWLELGTDYRKRQVAAGYTTPRFGRVPLGAKGVGRFAAHKLGDVIRVITRKEGCREIVVNIDWRNFEEGGKLIGDIDVHIQTREPKVFTEGQTGTRIVVKSLRDAWGKEQIRTLYRKTNSICSPFESIDDFSVELSVGGDNAWLERLVSVRDVVDAAPFYARFSIRDGVLKYEYEFKEIFEVKDKVAPRKVFREMRLPVEKVRSGGVVKEGVFSPEEIELLGMLGSFGGRFHIFDLDPKVLGLTVRHDKSGVRQYLRESGGVRVYRNKVRVFGLGDGDDWLNLGGRRVNDPSVRLSPGQMIGAVSLNLKRTHDVLLEKTNRQGFVENECFHAFRKAILFALAQIEVERSVDKERLRRIASSAPSRPVIDELESLRGFIKEKHPDLMPDVAPYLDRILRSFDTIQDRLLTAAGAGLGLSLVIHEAEKRVAELKHAVACKEVDVKVVKNLVSGVSDLLEGFARLLRSSPNRVESLCELVSDALFNMEHRFAYHAVSVDFDESVGREVVAKVRSRLIVSAIMNVLDNSIWWLRQKGADSKKVWIRVVADYDGGPAIVVADNGPGFFDPPELLVAPFVSRKKDGMGLGLYLVSEVMKIHKGGLGFPTAKAIGASEEYSGAVIALMFRG